MFRCSNPNCRQHNKGFILLGDKVSTEGMGFFKKLMTKWRDVREEIDIIYKDGNLQCTVDKDIDIYNDNKMICKECGHKDTVNVFMKAYENPMSMFDTENLCECGGEIWNDFETVKLEDEPQPDWVEGQSQRKVKMAVKTTTRCEKCNKEYPSGLL